MKRDFIIETIAGLLILLFVYTAVSKWLAFGVFKAALQTAPLIRHHAPVLAWAIPVSEIVVSLMLVMPRLKLSGLYASLGLLLLFTLYLCFMVLYSPYLPCSCGGVISYLSWQQHIAFNAFFIIINCVGIWLYKPTTSFNLLRNQAKPKTCRNE